MTIWHKEESDIAIKNNEAIFSNTTTENDQIVLTSVFNSHMNPQSIL